MTEYVFAREFSKKRRDWPKVPAQRTRLDGIGNDYSMQARREIRPNIPKIIEGVLRRGSLCCWMKSSRSAVGLAIMLGVGSANAAWRHRLRPRMSPRLIVHRLGRSDSCAARGNRHTGGEIGAVLHRCGPRILEILFLRGAERGGPVGGAFDNGTTQLGAATKD